MKKDLQLIRVFPIDHTIRVFLPVDNADQEEETRRHLAEWFNGAVTYHANVTIKGDDDCEHVACVTIVETHTDDEKWQAHRADLCTWVEELRQQLDPQLVLLDIDNAICPPEPLYTVDEAAEFLGLSVPSIRYHVNTVGDLHPAKRDPFLIFTRSELNRFKATPRHRAGRPKRKEKEQE